MEIQLLLQLSVPRHPENRQEHLATSTRSAGSTGYLQMKKKKSGGGTRTVHIPRNASLEECQTLAEGLFFPEGKSPVGELEKMITAMGNDHCNGQFQW